MSKVEMTDEERELATALRRSAAEIEQAPPFGRVFANAERDYEASRRRGYTWFAAAAAAVAVLAVVLYVDAPVEPEYIHIADLLETTSWTAPSDVLLPTHEFDIYQELPVLMESTEPVEGALL